MRRHADRLASHGYLALVVDLYKQRTPIICVAQTFAELRRRRGRAFEFIEAARMELARRGASRSIGIIGFCLGGGFALVGAMTGHGFQAASDNYGAIPANADAILRDACPIVARYGKRDPMPANKDAANRLRNALDSLQIPNDVYEDPRAGHAFMDDYGLFNRYGPCGFIARKVGLSYNGDAAEDAWAAIIAFFASYL